MTERKVMTERIHPYVDCQDFQRWDKGAASGNFMELKNMWSSPIEFTKDIKIGTAGSCFAQHLTRHLKQRDLNFLDMEPAPEGITGEEVLRNGYGIYSGRYGNIYTVDQLCQLFDEAFNGFKISEPVWETDGRYYDSMRPSVMPDGMDSAEAVINARKAHLGAVRKLFSTVDVFIFTLGLTEAWVSAASGDVFASAPGVSAGCYDKDSYRFKNYNYTDVMVGLEYFIKSMRDINKNVKFIFTVSPVPLKATYEFDHVLVSNSYSKSTLRAAAGDITKMFRGVYYFPSYEIITSHNNSGSFFDANGRSVKDSGVNFVMKHFFNDDNISEQINEKTLCDDDLI